MLWSRDIGEMHRLHHIIGDDDEAVAVNRSLRNLAARQLRELFLDFLGHFFRQLRIIRDDDARSQRVMLGLAQHIGSRIDRIRRLIGHDEDLARTGEHIDIDMAVHFFFGQRDEKYCPAP